MDIIKEINSRATSYLTSAKKSGYICPICNSGSGENGTGITTKDNIHFTCWSGCYTNSSLFDILSLQAGIDPNSNMKQAIDNACNILGIANNYTNSSLKNTIIENELKPAVDDQKALAYLEKRGIAPEIAKRFNLGIKQFTTKSGSSSFIVFPTGKGTYNARNILENCEKIDRYRKNKGEFTLFNIKALETSTAPVFITEGELDALSIIQSGGEAVALGGLANIDKVINKALEISFKPALIIALDNDPSGQAAIEKLRSKKQDLAKKGLKLYFPDLESLYLEQKDANDALQENEFLFRDTVEEALYRAIHLEETEKEEALLDLKKDSIANYKSQFENYIETSKQASYIPTGFNKLDELLDGGLYSGLYVVGAISSLGKTTLCLQIADQIAQSQKKDVLIFSLEMSKSELIAKSISRLTSVIDIEKTHSNTNAKTTRGILTGSRYKDYNETELQLIKDAKERYFSEIAPNIYITEGLNNIGVAQVREKVEAYTKVMGKAPIVLIDYIQLLKPAPEDNYSTDKKITDNNITALKVLSRDFNTSVIGISSFNRENYSSSVNMAAFKESGAIEYSSDVLIGLQYKAFSELSSIKDTERKGKAAEITADINQRAKDKKAIEIQLVVLKNRNGSRGSIDLDFFPLFNKFTEPVNTKK